MDIFTIERIKNLREDLDKTQEDVAKDLNEHKTTYARWEQNPNTIKLEKLIKLSEYYNVSIDYIAGLTNNKNINRANKNNKIEKEIANIINDEISYKRKIQIKNFLKDIISQINP